MNTTTTLKCPSCQKMIDLSSGTDCPNCGFRLSLGVAPAILQPIRRVQKISAAVLISVLIDRTGSTGAFAKGVPLMAHSILDKINAKARETKVYVHTGGDLDYDEPCMLISNGVSVPEAIAEIERLRYDGGGDEAETHVDSIQTVLTTTPWALDPRSWRNAFIAFLTADTKPARTRITARELGTALKDQGVLVYLVAEDAPFVHELVEAAQGLFFPISNDPDPAQMQQIAAGISQSILITAASTATRPMTVPVTQTP